MSVSWLLYLNKGRCKLQSTVVAAPHQNHEYILRSALGLDLNEAQLFLLVVHSGKMTVSRIAEACRWTVERARFYSSMLRDKGMLIEIGADEFESLHPRFALSNRYRRRCGELGVKFGRNDQVDSLAVYLEKYYDLARIK
jgi:hypothetical protein